MFEECTKYGFQLVRTEDLDWTTKYEFKHHTDETTVYYRRRNYTRSPFYKGKVLIKAKDPEKHKNFITYIDCELDRKEGNIRHLLAREKGKYDKTVVQVERIESTRWLAYLPLLFIIALFLLGMSKGMWTPFAVGIFASYWYLVFLTGWKEQKAKKEQYEF